MQILRHPFKIIQHFSIGISNYFNPKFVKVFSSAESLYTQAPAGRHVYHVSAASSESKTYCRIYIEMLMPVFRPSGAACL